MSEHLDIEAIKARLAAAHAPADIAALLAEVDRLLVRIAELERAA